MDTLTSHILNKMKVFWGNKLHSYNPLAVKGISLGNGRFSGKIRSSVSRLGPGCEGQPIATGESTENTAVKRIAPDISFVSNEMYKFSRNELKSFKLLNLRGLIDENGQFSGKFGSLSKREFQVRRRSAAVPFGSGKRRWDCHIPEAIDSPPQRVPMRGSQLVFKGSQGVNRVCL